MTSTHQGASLKAACSFPGVGQRKVLSIQWTDKLVADGILVTSKALSYPGGRSLQLTKGSGRYHTAWHPKEESLQRKHSIPDSPLSLGTSLQRHQAGGQPPVEQVQPSLLSQQEANKQPHADWATTGPTARKGHRPLQETLYTWEQC